MSEETIVPHPLPWGPKACDDCKKLQSYDNFRRKLCTAHKDAWDAHAREYPERKLFYDFNMDTVHWFDHIDQSKDDEGEPGDQDPAGAWFRYHRRPTPESLYPFTERQFVALLLLRGRYTEYPYGERTQRYESDWDWRKPNASP